MFRPNANLRGEPSLTTLETCLLMESPTPVRRAPRTAEKARSGSRRRYSRSGSRRRNKVRISHARSMPESSLHLAPDGKQDTEMSASSTSGYRSFHRIPNTIRRFSQHLSLTPRFTLEEFKNSELSRRMARRKWIMERRRHVSDVMLALTLVSLVLAAADKISERERLYAKYGEAGHVSDKYFHNHSDRCSDTTQMALRWLILIVSMVILFLVCYYTFLQLRLNMLTKGIPTLFLAVCTHWHRMAKFTAEVVIAFLIPYPICYSDSVEDSLVTLAEDAVAVVTPTILAEGNPLITPNITNNGTVVGQPPSGTAYSVRLPCVSSVNRTFAAFPQPNPLSLNESDLLLQQHQQQAECGTINLTWEPMGPTRYQDVVYTLMALRLYQIGRALILHSALFTTILSYSFGAMTKTRYNFPFVFKSLVSQHGSAMIISLAVGSAAAGAWCIYACDPRSYPDLAEAAWAVIITFFTVGYGDSVPSTYCSRAVAVLTGAAGTLCVALATTLLLNSLQHTYEEYRTFTMFIKMDMDKKYQDASADVIKMAVRAWRDSKHRKRQIALRDAKSEGGGGHEGSKPMRERSATRRMLDQMELLRVINKKKEVTRKVRESLDNVVPIRDLYSVMKQSSREATELGVRQKRTENSLKELKDKVNAMETGVDQLMQLVEIENSRVKSRKKGEDKSKGDADDKKQTQGKRGKKNSGGSSLAVGAEGKTEEIKSSKKQAEDNLNKGDTMSKVIWGTL